MTRTIVDRDAAVAALTEQFAAVRTLLGGLGEAQWQVPTALPGWRVHDVVAHVIGTESMLLGRQVPEAPAEVTGAAHVRGDIARLNERWIHAMAQATPAQMLADYDAVIGARLAALAETDQAGFDAESFTPIGPDSYGRFMRIRLFDVWLHEMDLRDALTLPAGPGGEGGDRGRLAFTEIEQALPMLLARRAQAPSGMLAALHLTGDLPTEVFIAVNGRGERVAAPERAPDLEMEMDSSLCVRLAGGRVAPADVRDRITVRAASEDARGWADRIPAALHFTI